MSINWSLRDFQAVLKKQDIHCSKVRVGDVLSTDWGVAQVARIEKVEEYTYRKVPGLAFYDEDDNSIGGACLEGKQYETHVRIIDRRAIHKGEPYY